MKYALGNMLNGGIQGLDPNAKAYINAVVAAGATVTSTQRTAINNFVKGEKAGSRWTLLKRLYLPIWGVAAPNAICMTSSTSGTFVGGVTHSSGYVTTNGSTGHFLSDASPGQAGCTLNGTGVYALYTAAASLLLVNSQTYFGSQSSDAGTRIRLSGGSAETARFSFFGPYQGAFSSILTAGDQRGIQFLGRDTSTNRFIVLRQGSNLLSQNQTNTSSALNSTIPMCWLANNNNGTVANYPATTARLGAAGMTEGMSQANAEAFTINLKTLWETCTGLTLP